jgi:hypothetical protein
VAAVEMGAMGLWVMESEHHGPGEAVLGHCEITI